MDHQIYDPDRNGMNHHFFNESFNGLDVYLPKCE